MPGHAHVISAADQGLAKHQTQYTLHAYCCDAPRLSEGFSTVDNRPIASTTQPWNPSKGPCNPCRTDGPTRSALIVPNSPSAALPRRAARAGRETLIRGLRRLVPPVSTLPATWESA